MTGPFAPRDAIHEAAPQTKILMIGMEDDQEMFLRAVQAGAEGYLLRDASAKQILAAVHRLERNAVVCPQHLERALFNLIANGPRLHVTRAAIHFASLTPREHQLTSLLAQGLANKEIAGRLNLSLQTVKNHVHSILQKTQSKNRAMLAQLVEPQPSPSGPPSRLTSRLTPFLILSKTHSTIRLFLEPAKTVRLSSCVRFSTKNQYATSQIQYQETYQNHKKVPDQNWTLDRPCVRTLRFGKHAQS